MTYCGIEIGGTKMQIAECDSQGKVLQRHRVEFDRQRGAAGIRAALLQSLGSILAERPPVALGVGFGGPVNWQSGMIARSFQVEGWTDFPLKDWLRDETSVPVIVENDANVATLAEALCGAGRGKNPVFYTNSGSGVGAGLVVEERLYHGQVPGELEFGHVRLSQQGETVQDRCSGWGIAERIRWENEQHPDSKLFQLTQGVPAGEETRALGEALAAGDPLAQQIVTEAARDYAFGISHVVHLLHPEIVVLGGGVSLLGEPWRSGVAQALPNFLMDAFRPGPQVVLAELGEDIVPVGAALLAAQTFG